MANIYNFTKNTATDLVYDIRDHNFVNINFEYEIDQDQLEHLLSRVNDIYREINDLEKGTYVFVFRNESLRFVRDKPSYIFTDQEINKNKIASLLLYKKENLRDMKKDKISKRC